MALARSHYEIFPVASRVLPAPMRPHVAAVYGLARVADDIADIREKMEAIEQIVALQSRVNSIEQQLRGTRIEVRLGTLEEKVFGTTRR